VECAGCLDLLFIKQALTEAELDQGKVLLSRIVGLLVGLIKSKSPERFREEAVEYRVDAFETENRKKEEEYE